MRPQDFEHVYVITSPKTKHRLDGFFKRSEQVRFLFPECEVFHGVDGDIIKPPAWWYQEQGKRKRGNGAWGCFLAHYALMALALSYDYSNIIVFEDDCAFDVEAPEKITACLAQLPQEWDMCYFGGQHLNTWKGVPKFATDDLCKGFDINRMHAYAASRSGIKKIYECFQTMEQSTQALHQDHWVGQCMQRGTIQAYACYPWVCGQEAGFSSLLGHDEPAHTWNTPALTCNQRLSPAAVLKYGYVGYGSIGLDGQAGIDDLTLPTTTGSISIGCHAPASLCLDLDAPHRIHFGTLPSYKTAQVDFVLDGKTVGQANAGNFLSEPFELATGRHTIVINAPHGNWFAHTFLNLEPVETPQSVQEHDAEAVTESAPAAEPVRKEKKKSVRKTRAENSVDE